MKPTFLCLLECVGLPHLSPTLAASPPPNSASVSLTPSESNFSCCMNFFPLIFLLAFFPQCYLLVVIIPLRHSLKYPLILKIFFPSSSHLPLRSNPIDLFSSLFFRLISCSRVALIVFFSSFLNIKWPVHNLSFLISPFPVNTFVLLVFLSLWLQLRQPASHLILPITHFGQSISRLPNHNNLRSFRFLCV